MQFQYYKTGSSFLLGGREKEEERDRLKKLYHLFRLNYSTLILNLKMNFTDQGHKTHFPTVLDSMFYLKKVDFCAVERDICIMSIIANISPVLNGECIVIWLVLDSKANYMLLT